LRRPKELRRTSPFGDLRHEYGLLRELDTTAIPTLTPVLFCEDDSVVGEPFFLTTYLGSAAIRLGSELPGPFQDPQLRRSVATDLIDTLAAIHSLDAVPFEDVCERRSPRGRSDR
jgi:aminoglycoside phosphotransferase (APT) family kinase protein